MCYFEVLKEILKLKLLDLNIVYMLNLFFRVCKLRKFSNKIKKLFLEFFTKS